MRLHANDEDLDTLLARCRRHDAAAWSAVMRRYQGLVYSISRKYGLADDDAGDVFSRTFERLLKNLDKIESGAVLGRWLGVTAARESLRILRTNSRHRSADTDGLSLEDLVATEEAEAEREAIAADQALRAREAMANLPERCRGLLALLYSEEDLSYAEISSRSGVPVGAIGPTRARCLDKLRDLLEVRGFFA
ncbi:MAG: RNA polymerase sigma factor [Fimbriimonas sp.]